MNTINAVLVRVGQTHDFQTDSGIYVSVAGHRDDYHVRIYGTVTAIPKKLTGKLCGHIDPIIRVGDKVYFHYLGKGEEIYDKEFIIDYYNIFCVVRDGEIIPVGDWAFFEPYYEEDVEEVFINDKIGSIKAVIGKSGLIHSADPKISARMAKCCYIVDHEFVRQGDIVYLEPKFEFENEIEGKKYFLSKKQYILGKHG